MDIDDLKTTYRQVFTTEDGKAVLEDLEKRFHLMATTFERGDPHFSAFLEGQRSVLLAIKGMIKTREDRIKEVEL
jgi:hypothetical protein